MGDRSLTSGGDVAVLSAADEAHLAMFDPKVMLAGHIMYLVATVGVYAFYRDVTPPDTMALWLTLAIAALSVSTLFCAAFFLRRPSPREILGFWRKIDKRMTHVFDFVAVASIFLLFQHGGEGHRLVALAFCVGYGPMQLISDPENLLANRISVCVILGSFAVQLFRMGHDSAVVLSVLFAFYGGTLLFAAGVFHEAFATSVEQKKQSDEAASMLRIAVAEATASRDAKTRFIANASHDLGQPLMAASLYVNELAKAKAPAKAVAIVRSLQQAIGNSQSLIAHMLHYLRLEADAVKPMMTRVNLGDVFEHVSALRLPDAELRKINFKIFASKRSLTADASLLIRAIDNLVSNAFVHSGGTKVLLGVKSSGKNRIRIWTIDNGRGIRTEPPDSMFEDFAQGDNLAKGGFGLGLSSVRRIAKLHSGNAGIAHHWKHGCAFFIELEAG